MVENYKITKDPFFAFKSDDLEFQIKFPDDSQSVYGIVIDFGLRTENDDPKTTYSHPTRWVLHFVNKVFGCSTSLNDNVSFSISEDEHGPKLFFQGSFGTLEIHSNNELTYTSNDSAYPT